MERPKTLPLPTIRRVALGLYLLALSAYVVRVGIPVERLVQTAWILAGILVARIGHPWRHNVRVFADWIPFLVLLIVYDYTRGFADTLGMPVLVGWPIHVDELVAGGVVPTVWLQEHLYDPGRQHWWDVVAALTYSSHFLFPWLFAALLYVRSRKEWVWYARRVLILSAAGLTTYILFPATPPWLAAADGALGSEVTRISAQGWSAIGLRGARVLIERAQGGVNLVAALPSLHAAFSLLVTLALWRYVRSRWLRVAMLAYPLAMGFSLVYGGEHYVIDVLLGWAYVAVILVVAAAAERWWQARRSRLPVWQAAEHPMSVLSLIGPDEHPQTVGGDGNGRGDAGGGEAVADQIGVGASVRPGDRDE